MDAHCTRDASSRVSRVFVHVGAPITAAAYLRGNLARNRRRLTRHGVLYPGSHLGHDGGHLDAVLDVLELASSDHAASTGAWDRLAETVRDWRRGTVVISHELLADATVAQIERIVSSFGNIEVHVVYVARDLGRQLPLAWQEWVRNGGRSTFTTYLNKVVGHDEHRLGRVFWQSHAVDEVLARWATCVPQDRIHLLTVPIGDSHQAVLWERFAQTVGVDPRKLRAGAVPASPQVGLVQTEVLRLLNVATEDTADARPMERVRRTLEAQGGRPPAVPVAHADRLRAEADRMTSAVKDAGYDVVGDITDLFPEPEVFAASADDVVPADRDVLAAQTRALGDLAGLRDKRSADAGQRRLRRLFAGRHRRRPTRERDGY